MARLLRRGALASALFACVARPARASLRAALDAPAPVAARLSDLFRARFSLRDQGLPDVVARALAQGPDGFLWVGTFEGLARFDGRRFRVARAAQQPELIEDGFVGLLCDRSGRLWAGGMRSLRRRDRSGWHPIAGIDEQSGPIVALVEAGDGTVWCGGPALHAIDAHDRAQRIEPPPRDPADRSGWQLACDADGVLHVACESVAARWRGDDWEVIADAAALGSTVRGIARSRVGGLWLVAGGRARRLVAGRAVEERAVPPELGNDFATLLEDSAGNLWVGSFAYGLALLPPGGAAPLVAALGTELLSSNIAALLEDADGVIHVGTGGGGLASLTPRRVRDVHLGGAYSLDDAISCFAVEPSGRLLAANAAGNVVAIEGGQPKPLLQMRHRFGTAQIHGIEAAADGTLWIGTNETGLWSVVGDALAERHPAERVGRDVGAFLTHGAALWFGSSSGAWSIEGATLRRHEGLPDGASVRDLSLDRAGAVWSCGSAGVHRAEGGAFAPIAVELDGAPLVARPVRALRWLDDDYALLSLVAGERCVALARRDGATLRARRLVTDLPASDFAVVGAHVWLNGDDALRRFAIDELCRWHADRSAAAPPAPLRLSIADGLPTSQTAGSEARRIAQDADGRLWFATTAGLAWLDPAAALPLERLPMVVLDECLVDGVALRVERGQVRVSLPAGANSVRLAFSVPVMRGAEGVQLAYRSGPDARFVKVGPERLLEFPELPAGLHRFELRASNGDGRWSQSLTTVELLVPPFWWQTRTFRYLVVVGLVGGLALVYVLADRVAARRARERIAAAEALAAAHARSELLLSATDELVCFADPAGRITALNQAGREILGGDARPARVEVLLDLVAPAVRPLFEQDALPELREHGRWTGETLLEGAGGRAVPVLASLLRHELPDGRVEFLSLVARDLSERVATEQAHRELEAQLRQSQKLEAIGTLAGGIAHDFNNLLTAILGHAELAEAALRQEPPAPDEAIDGLIEIRQASGRARDLVRQILRFSRRGEQQRALVVVDSVVREACRMVRSSFPADVELSVVVTAPGGTVMADPTEIHQVVVNLCTNAAQAMPAGKGKIEVDLAEVDVDEELARSVPRLRPGRWLRLSVADDGVGMSAEVMERVFEPFFTTKGPGEGTGLGLAMVHGIVGSHDGAVTVSSAVGKGTRVEVWLPIVRAASEVEQPLPDELPRGSGQRVLLVDDESAVLELGRRMLERLGYAVTACAHPAAAIAQVEATPTGFDVVVNDLSMPDLNGVQLARRLQQLSPGLPMVLVTGYLTGIVRDELAAHGIVELLYKPFDLRSLAVVLARALKTRLNDRASS